VQLAKKLWNASARKNPLAVDAAAMAADRGKVKASELLDRPHPLALSALPAARTPDSPRMAQAQRTAAHPARKANGVTALSAAHATQRPMGCPATTLSTNPLRTTKKTISNPAPMRIWAPKVV
jgi:microcompartment protein CcmL/EutN